MGSRVAVVQLSLPMGVSLDVLGERQGLPVGTIAFRVLREALRRTMDVDIVRVRVSEIAARSTVAAWGVDRDLMRLQLRRAEAEGDGGAMRSKRITVKLSLPMEVALDVLGERQGLPVGTIAFQKLREGLQRTMDTDIVQERVGKIKAQSTNADWRHDQEIAAIQLRIEEIDDAQAAVSQG